ncbi:MAG TPA: hypothetical protein VNZ58_12380 [Thermomicrobiales bacterium]|nr:hypothetical protein [Thermomicrobiales bacterium]
MSSFPQFRRRPIAIMAVFLLAMTMIGVVMSTTQSIIVNPADPAPSQLSVDERTYYEYVAPRLDRLVEEVDQVVEKANRKSRDLIALSLSEARIDTLTDEIMTFAEENGVPERFRPIHEEIVNGTTSMIDTFGQAKSALSRLNFSRMPALLQEFNDAAAELHSAQDGMYDVTGQPEAPSTNMQGSTT